MASGTEIKIFFTEACRQDAPPPTWMLGMAQEKRRRIDGLKNEKDKRLAVTAHRLLCYALHVACGISPSADDWATGWHGKPYLKNAPHVHYNISHSGNMAMCAVHSAPVGADIERMRPADEKPARYIMSKEEWAVFEAAQDKDALFYKIWTLKEAYIKYNGRGLDIDLCDLTVYPDGREIVCRLPGCRFALIDAADGYQAAICAADVSYSTEWVREEMLAQF